MNIVACIKRVPLTDVQFKPGPDGKSLDTTGFGYMTSFYDEIAVEEAIRTKEKVGGEVTIVTIGSEDATKEVRECLAKGGDKAVLLKDADWMSRDARSVAKVLAAEAQALGAELVFCGRVATDRDNASVGPMLATLLDWPCIGEVDELDIADGKGTAKRSTDDGVETVEFTLPAVVTCNKDLNEPRYAGLKGIMAAKKKPLETKDFEDVPNQVDVVAVEAPPARPEGRIVGEGPDAVAALIEALQNEAQVL